MQNLVRIMQIAHVIRSKSLLLQTILAVVHVLKKFNMHLWL